MASNCQLTVLANSQATKQLGKILGEILPANISVLLEGDLGSGKTTLVQGIAQGLGITEAIVSPTFTLINEYKEGRLPLYHLDLYRLDSKEVATIYPEMYWEGIEVTPGITAIEWSQRLEYKPSHYIELKFSHCLPEGRQVQWQIVGSNRFESELWDKLKSIKQTD